MYPGNVTILQDLPVWLRDRFDLDDPEEEDEVFEAGCDSDEESPEDDDDDQDDLDLDDDDGWSDLDPDEDDDWSASRPSLGASKRRSQALLRSLAGYSRPVQAVYPSSTRPDASGALEPGQHRNQHLSTLYLDVRRLRSGIEKEPGGKNFQNEL